MADVSQGERVSGKGELTRKRTVSGPREASADGAFEADNLIAGRVISVHGLKSRVLADDGVVYECALRQVLKSLSIDQRSVLVAGDHVRIRAESVLDGMIEQVEPRRGMISRTSRGQQHILVANVDYLLIIASAAEPGLKPALIDRFLMTAEQCEVEPVVVINKIDLIDPADLQQIAGVYASMGYRVLMTSAETGCNIDYLKALLDRQANRVWQGRAASGRAVS